MNTKLWRKVLVLPASIAICERGFSKQYLIKNYLRSSLKLVTLDALMRISCANIAIENINWKCNPYSLEEHERSQNSSSSVIDL